MYSKLFGESIDEQEKYLKIRVIVTIIGLISLLIGAIVKTDIGALICVIALFMWGWSIMRAVFGVTSFLSIFALAYNPIMIVLIFIAFVFIGYLGGIIIAPIGIYRFISIKMARRG